MPYHRGQCSRGIVHEDFGSIEGSFEYLKSIPIDFVKIDGRFVKHMAENLNDSAVVQSINEISHLFGLETIAEFVESEEILHRLGEMGVDWAQGYGVEAPFALDER